MAFQRMLGVDSVDYHRETVIDRADDHPGVALGYYTERGESPLVWGGTGVVRLGLEGHVRLEHYEDLFGPGGARDPVTSDRLARTKRPGLELVVSAHKSVAELGVIGRVEDMHTILDAEREGTMAYLDQLARNAGGRRGRAATTVPTSGLVYASTRHVTSRAADPLPHDHVLIANVVEMLDAKGGWKAADTALLRDHVHAATAYGRMCAAKVAVDLGYGIVPDDGPSGRLGHWAIAGVPELAMEIHSKRSAEIDDEMERVGFDSYRARSRASRSPTTSALGSEPFHPHLDTDRALTCTWRSAGSVKAMAALSERYKQGEREQVWRELVELGPRVFDPDWHDDAWAVAMLTMERVATNVSTLIGRLNRLGYRYGVLYELNRRKRVLRRPEAREMAARIDADMTWLDEPYADEHAMEWSPPGAEIAREVGRAERAIGPLPLSLKALLLQVNHVQLQGSLRTWNPSAFTFDEEDWPAFGVYSDPLNVNGVGVITEYFERGADQIGAEYLSGGHHMDEHGVIFESPVRFTMAFGSDDCMSAGFSGGCHNIVLPDQVADPVVGAVHGRPGLRLVEYLRTAFRWGGFPGFEFADKVPPEIEELRSDLLPI